MKHKANFYKLSIASIHLHLSTLFKDLFYFRNAVRVLAKSQRCGLDNFPIIQHLVSSSVGDRAANIIPPCYKNSVLGKDKTWMALGEFSL